MDPNEFMRSLFGGVAASVLLRCAEKLWPMVKPLMGILLAGVLWRTVKRCGPHLKRLAITISTGAVRLVAGQCRMLREAVTYWTVRLFLLWCTGVAGAVFYYDYVARTDMPPVIPLTFVTGFVGFGVCAVCVRLERCRSG